MLLPSTTYIRYTSSCKPTISIADADDTNSNHLDGDPAQAYHHTIESDRGGRVASGILATTNNRQSP